MRTVALSLLVLPGLALAACAPRPAPLPTTGPAPPLATGPAPTASPQATGPAPKGPVRVALTFDDLPAHGPLPEGTSRLDVITALTRTLAAHHVPPVYGFTNGGKLREHPEDAGVLRAWVGAGNLLGNHGFSHLSLDEGTTIEAYLKDIDDNEETLRAHSPPGTPERSWKVYRYPFLQEGRSAAVFHRVREHLGQRGYRVAEVSIDFGDWAWNPAYARCARKHDDRAIKALDTSYKQEAMTFLRWSKAAAWQALGREIAQVVLLHVGAADARALDATLTAYEKAGVVFVPLDAALDDPAYAGETNYYAKWGESYFEMLADGLGTVTLPMPTMPLPLLDGICR